MVIKKNIAETLCSGKMITDICILICQNLILDHLEMIQENKQKPKNHELAARGGPSTMPPRGRTLPPVIACSQPLTARLFKLARNRDLETPRLGDTKIVTTSTIIPKAVLSAFLAGSG